MILEFIFHSKWHFKSCFTQKCIFPISLILQVFWKRFCTTLCRIKKMSLKCATKCKTFKISCKQLIIRSFPFINEVDRALEVETWILFFVCRRVFAQWLRPILQFALQNFLYFFVSCLFLVSMSVLRAPNMIRCMYSTRILDGWRINEKLAEKVLYCGLCVKIDCLALTSYQGGDWSHTQSGCDPLWIQCGHRTFYGEKEESRATLWSESPRLQVWCIHEDRRSVRQDSPTE